MKNKIAKRIFLIGLMGSGKSYWGEKIAVMLQWKFIDLDRFIEEKEQMTIPEIFEKYGETHFRELEKSYLREMESLDNHVVATGGGTPCFHGNMELMNKMGETYYLKVKPETVSKRLQNQIKDRPLLKGKNNNELVSFFTKQLKEREPFYFKAKHMIDGDRLEEIKLRALFQGNI